MNNIKNKNNFALIFIIFLTSFLLWFIVSFTIIEKNNNWLLKSIDLSSNLDNLYEQDLDLSKYFEVYKIIKNNNYDSEGIKKDELVESSVKWLVEWLWDKHSEYMTSTEATKFNEVLSWDFEWIWAVVQKNELWVLIDRIIKWSPAKKYWLKSWDIIIKANEEKLEWLDLFDAVWKIKWPAWTKVILEILRSGESDILKIEVIREKIKIPSVESELYEEQNIWYISINMFWEDTSLEFFKAIKELKNTKWLIIDLRYNWGWYLQSATEILSNLIESWKPLVITKYKEDYLNMTYPSINNWDIYDWKIVILINESSASASEITAWALKDYKKAILVWKKSYGKWSVQKPFLLKDWSMLKLTIAKWFTPNDINIDHEWIIPDIEIDFEKQDYTPEEWKEEEFVPYDRQLEEAKKILKLFIENNAYQITIDKYLESKKD